MLVNKQFLASLTLLFTPVFATTVQCNEVGKDLPRDEIFHPAYGEAPSLQGKILQGRYYAPKSIFSCKAYDFGEGKYVAQDGLLEEQGLCCVGFYNSLADFKKAEIIFFPVEKKLNKTELKDIFKDFGIGILKRVDNAQGIEVLKEEMLEDNMFFAALSVKKISFLKSPSGEHLSPIRGYLIFQGKDFLAVLSNQIIPHRKYKHEPKRYVDRLKEEILEFQKTFEFGSMPIPVKITDED